MIFTRSDFNEHYTCVDVIEDCIDNDKDVIIELTLCIVRDIVFTAYIINAFVPKQVDIGLDNSAEIHDLSPAVVMREMSEMSRF